MTTKSSNQFLTLPELQVFLGVKSRKTILKYIKSGELPAYKLGGTRWRMTRADVEAFIKRQQVRHKHSRGAAVPLQVVP